MGAGDEAHREAEHRADHIIDRIGLVDDDDFRGQILLHEPYSEVGQVQFLRRTRRWSRVDVDAAVHWAPRRVIDSQYGTPERNTPAILVQIENLYLVLPEGHPVRRTALFGGLAAFRGGIG